MNLKIDPCSHNITQLTRQKGDVYKRQVAESVKDNPALQRMMQRMTLQSMLKQAGDVIKPEDIKALNDALQKIKKVTD